jgi:methionine synthase II (cobalamin-independent)
VPRLDGPPDELGGAAGTVPGPRVATLPSPHTFAHAAHTSGDRAALTRDIGANVLAPVVADLAGRGFELIHLEEPWLPYHGIDDGGWGALEDALEAVRDSAAGRVAVVLHTYFADAGPFAERLRKLPVDAVGIDLVETNLDELGSNWEVGVVAGVIDGRRSLVEDPAHVAAFAAEVAERLQPPVMYLSSNSELEMLPTEVAERKVRALGEAAARLKEAGL